MQIFIRETNGFMPPTKINIKYDKIEVEENNNTKVLKYEKEEIKLIIMYLSDMFKGWREKYIDNKIIDDEVYFITIIDNGKRKEIYIKNKYPNNWSKFITFRNKLLREEL